MFSIFMDRAVSTVLSGELSSTINISILYLLLSSFRTPFRRDSKAAIFSDSLYVGMITKTFTIYSPFFYIKQLVREILLLDTLNTYQEIV